MEYLKERGLYEEDESEEELVNLFIQNGAYLNNIRYTRCLNKTSGSFFCFFTKTQNKLVQQVLIA